MLCNIFFSLQSFAALFYMKMSFVIWIYLLMFELQ